jgi:hypothetical protein
MESARNEEPMRKAIMTASVFRFRQRGTAMTEFVLALPVLAFILGLLLFLGWSLMRQQHVVAAGRYALWRQMEGGACDAATVNQRLLGNAARSVDMTGGTFPGDAMKLWVAAGAQNQVGTLADTLFIHVPHWPSGEQIRLDVHYSPPTWLGRKFGNDFTIRYARDGVPWARGEAQPWSVLTEQYYQDLDDQLSGVPADGQPVATILRDMYGRPW